MIMIAKCALNALNSFGWKRSESAPRAYRYLLQLCNGCLQNLIAWLASLITEGNDWRFECHCKNN